MYRALLLFTFISAKDVFASYCYPDFCLNTTNSVSESHAQCLLQPIKTGKECVQMKFENLGHVPLTGQPLAQVSLLAYVKELGELKEKTTAFNFSIINVHFNRLITRFQNLEDEETSICRSVNFYGNVTNFPLKEFYMSCPFFNSSFENSPYRLEYLVSQNNYEYSRKLVFVVPNHRYIDETVKDIRFYTPFFYIDVSEASTLTLFIQSVPQRFNVSAYKVWMINYDTNHTKEIILENFNKSELIHHNFSVENDVVYFKVAALHSICHKHGCINSTSPFISMKQPSHRLLIMIISCIWIPPVILYAVYHIYKLYKKKEILKRAERKPKCLLVYSPSHMTHVNTMIDLARYLRCCNINAMVDSLDIPESTNKDPISWCNESFHCADVILIATSPQTDTVAPVMYRNVDNQALCLLKENYMRHNKRYYTLQFPYCKPEDIPKEAQQFKRFLMPEDLNKLVKTIHEVEYIRFFGVSDKDFIDSIKLAKMQIVQTERNSQTTEDNEDLLLPCLGEKTKNSEIFQMKKVENKSDYTSINKNLSKISNKNINEINLLGESDDGDIDTFCFKSSDSSSKLNLHI